MDGREPAILGLGEKSTITKGRLWFVGLPDLTQRPFDSTQDDPSLSYMKDVVCGYEDFGGHHFKPILL